MSRENLSLGLGPDKTQTGLLNYRDLLKSWNLGFSKYRYYTIYAVNNKGFDQTVQMHRLICTLIVCIWHKQNFSWHGSKVWLSYSQRYASSVCSIWITSNESPHDKTNKMACAPSEDSGQPGHPPSLIRVFGCPGWSESSLSVWRKLGSLATHRADSEDSDQTGRMPRLIWVFAGRKVILLVLSWGSSKHLASGQHIEAAWPESKTLAGIHLSRKLSKVFAWPTCQGFESCWRQFYPNLNWPFHSVGPFIIIALTVCDQKIQRIYKPQIIMHAALKNVYLSWYKSEPPHDKTNEMDVRPAKTQISLGILPVWSESSLSTWRNLGFLAAHWVHSEDSDQAGWMSRLIWVFAGRTGQFVGFVMMRLIW